MSSLPQDFIFRFSFPCLELNGDPVEPTPEFLDERYRFPYWNRHEIPTKFAKSLDESGTERSIMPNESISFEFRMGWRPKGLAITVLLAGKHKPLAFDRSRLESSDGLRLCLDTRDVRDVHRGTRFCHKFLFLPVGSESKQAVPVAHWLPIHRAKAHPNPVDVSRFLLASDVRSDGYSLSVWIPGETLTGYDPKEYSRLGIHFSLYDNELGSFDLQHSTVLPVEEDPSLWSVLELIESNV